VARIGSFQAIDGVQVSPWGVRQLLMALSVDCSILEELKSTNYSLLVLVCPGAYVFCIRLIRKVP
jgi:hypothetical protein